MIRALLFAALLALTACAPKESPPLVATGVEITAARPGMAMRAGYMTLENNGSEPVRITHVTSPQFGAVEIHETIIEDDIARMRELDALEIAPGETARLERGGKHLMLMRPSPQAADASEFTLNLYAGDELLLSVIAGSP